MRCFFSIAATATVVAVAKNDLEMVAARIRVARFVWNDEMIREKFTESRNVNPELWKYAADVYESAAIGTGAPESIEELVQGDLGSAVAWLDKLAQTATLPLKNQKRAQATSPSEL